VVVAFGVGDVIGVVDVIATGVAVSAGVVGAGAVL